MIRQLIYRILAAALSILTMIGDPHNVSVVYKPALPPDFLNQGSSAVTVSQSHVEQVQRYLARQKEHHQNISFRDEFILFLKANGIEYDERYL